jgi:hypothetical protein
MARQKIPYTDAETALAKRLFADSQASGTLKSPGLFALALSNGYRESASRAATWRDYLRDARRQLAAR